MTSPLILAPIRLGLAPVWPWLLLVGTPVLGGTLGWGLARLARAAEALPWVPFQEPLALATMVPVGWVVFGLVVIGAGVGAWLAYEAQQADLVLLVGPDAIEARQGGQVERHGRDAIAGLLRDGPDVVLLAHGGGELLRGPSEASLLATASACEAMGYPWLGEGDPFAAEWHLWIDGHPDLDARSHALLRLRQVAVKAEDKVRARMLARDLGQQALAVRDGPGGQSIRRKSRSNTP